MSSRIVDLDIEPFVAEGWSVQEHRKGGVLDFGQMRFSLHLSSKQSREGRIVGIELYEKLKGLPVLNANLLDWFLRTENQCLIPEDWKGSSVFFWGTIYRHRGGNLFVRSLSQDESGRGWCANWRWIGDFFGKSDPAVFVPPSVSC